jgi:hypothetical protein
MKFAIGTMMWLLGLIEGWIWNLVLLDVISASLSQDA